MNENYKKFLTYVIPCMISMMSMAVFTVVDGIFVSRGVGSQALAAVNVVYPVILLLTAFSAMLALGASVMISSRLASGNKEGANLAFMNCVYLGLIFFLAVAFFSILFAKEISKALGAEGDILLYAAEYLRTYMYFAIPSGIITILSAAVRNDNNPMIASVSLTVSSVINIFGDWLFVYPLQMGVAGAAYATGISQVIGLLILLDHFIRKKGSLNFSFKVKLQWPECKSMIRRGFPECISQLTVPVITVCYNLVLARLLGDMGLQAYAIISQPISIIIIMFLGVADGTQPLFSYSHSIGDKKTNRYYFKKAVELNMILSVVIYLAFFFFGRNVFRIFSSNEALLDMAMTGNRLYSLNFFFCAITMVIACYFMSISSTKNAIIINLCRTFLFNIIFIFLTPYLLGANMVWLGIVFAEFAVMLVAILLYRRYQKARKETSL